MHTEVSVKKPIRGLACEQPRDRPVLDLTWDYPLVGPHDEPDAECILQEVSGRKADGSFLSSYDELERVRVHGLRIVEIHCGVYARW